MISHNETVKAAYEILKQHNPFLADRLCNDIKYAAKNLEYVTDRKRQREAKYNSSLWQWLNYDEYEVLRPFNYAIEDAQTHYYACENDMLCAAEDVEKETILRKDLEIEAGNLVYYVVDLGTNVRKSVDGVPVIYSTMESGEWYCSEADDRVISIAEYDRRYGAFVVDHGGHK